MHATAHRNKASAKWHARDEYSLGDQMDVLICERAQLLCAMGISQYCDPSIVLQELEPLWNWMQVDNFCSGSWHAANQQSRRRCQYIASIWIALRSFSTARTACVQFTLTRNCAETSSSAFNNADCVKSWSKRIDVRAHRSF